MKRNKEWGISLVTAGVGIFAVFTFVFFLARFPAEMLAGVNNAFLGATKLFSVPLMTFTFITTILAFYLALGKYGKIKLGEGKPEYSNFSYITMMALAALASAAVYWSFTEWAVYYGAPGLHLEAFSTDALEASLGYAFFHWGFATQGPYVLAGVAVAYAAYNKKVPLMKISAVCECMMGNYKHKKVIGKLIDISVVFCIVGAAGCTLGLAVPLETGALRQVFGIKTTFTVQIGIVLAIAAIFTFTSFLGMDKGKKVISNLAAGLCISFLLYILFAGPTNFILKNFVSSLGWMGDKYLRMSFFTDPIENSGFPEQWTVFFQAFCLTYTALMGIFVAKISKGRTIKEVALNCLFGISVSVWVLFAIDGGYSIYAQTEGIVSVTDILAGGSGQDLVYGIIETLPGGAKILPFVMLIMIAGFVASSLDSASFSLAQTITTKLDKNGNVSTRLRIMCCLVLTLVPLSMMFVGADFSALKSLAILVSIPFMFVMIYMEFMLFKWLKKDDQLVRETVHETEMVCETIFQPNFKEENNGGKNYQFEQGAGCTRAI